MAREERRRASVRPSQADEGGDFGFPQGAVVTLTEAKWTTWDEAGEKALVGDRSGDDPCLKLTGEVEDIDDPREVFLSAGKASRLEPDEDGEFLIGMGNISKNCNANVFLASVTTREKSDPGYKIAKVMQGKMALSEELLDKGISCLEGLKFKAGRIKITREGLDGDTGGRPTLISEENIELPGKSKGKKSTAGAKKKAKDEDEEEEEETDTDEEEDDEDEDDEDTEIKDAAEKAVLGLLENPKFRKGIPEEKRFVAVHNAIRDLDKKTQKKVEDLVRDEDWVGHKDRPWSFEDGTITAV